MTTLQLAGRAKILPPPIESTNRTDRRLPSCDVRSSAQLLHASSTPIVASVLRTPRSGRGLCCRNLRRGSPHTTQTHLNLMKRKSKKKTKFETEVNRETQDSVTVAGLVQLLQRGHEQAEMLARESRRKAHVAIDGALESISGHIAWVRTLIADAEDVRADSKAIIGQVDAVDLAITKLRATVTQPALVRAGNLPQTCGPNANDRANKQVPPAGTKRKPGRPRNSAPLESTTGSAGPAASQETVSQYPPPPPSPTFPMPPPPPPPVS